MTEHAATFDHVLNEDEYVLVVSGELDAASAESFAEAAYQSVNAHQNLVLDLQRASFMDSSGLKVLATVAVARADRGACWSAIHAIRSAGC